MLRIIFKRLNSSTYLPYGKSLNSFPLFQLLPNVILVSFPAAATNSIIPSVFLPITNVIKRGTATTGQTNKTAVSTNLSICIDHLVFMSHQGNLWRFQRHWELGKTFSAPALMWNFQGIPVELGEISWKPSQAANHLFRYPWIVSTVELPHSSLPSQLVIELCHF